MKPFDILQVATGADRGFSEATGPTVEKFTDIAVRIHSGFDWEKDSRKLLKKLRAATDLDEL